MIMAQWNDIRQGKTNYDNTHWKSRRLAFSSVASPPAEVAVQTLHLYLSIGFLGTDYILDAIWNGLWRVRYPANDRNIESVLILGVTFDTKGHLIEG